MAIIRYTGKHKDEPNKKRDTAESVPSLALWKPDIESMSSAKYMNPLVVNVGRSSSNHIQVSTKFLVHIRMTVYVH